MTSGCCRGGLSCSGSLLQLWHEGAWWPKRLNTWSTTRLPMAEAAKVEEGIIGAEDYCSQGKGRGFQQKPKRKLAYLDNRSIWCKEAPTYCEEKAYLEYERKLFSTQKKKEETTLWHSLCTNPSKKAFSLVYENWGRGLFFWSILLQ